MVFYTLIELEIGRRALERFFRGGCVKQGQERGVTEGAPLQDVWGRAVGVETWKV